MAFPDGQVCTNKQQAVIGNAVVVNQPTYLRHMVTQTILSIAKGAELAQHQHRGFAFHKTAHALRLHHRRDQRVKVVLGACGGGDVTGARLGALLPWRGCRTGELSTALWEPHVITQAMWLHQRLPLADFFCVWSCPMAAWTFCFCWAFSSRLCCSLFILSRCKLLRSSGGF